MLHVSIRICAGHLIFFLPLTSAPAEKNRPSPVRTVNTVLGFSLSSLIAVIVSSIILPPNAFRDLGRLNCNSSQQRNMSLSVVKPDFDDANLAGNLNDNIIILGSGRHHVILFLSCQGKEYDTTVLQQLALRQILQILMISFIELYTRNERQQLRNQG